MKTFRWTLPTLPLTNEERDGNKGNARKINHPSELTPDDLSFAQEWEKTRQKGLPFHLAITGLKVFALFLLLTVLAVFMQENINVFTLSALSIGSILGLFLRIKSRRLIWDRSEKRYQSIIAARQETQ